MNKSENFSASSSFITVFMSRDSGSRVESRALQLELLTDQEQPSSRLCKVDDETRFKLGLFADKARNQRACCVKAS